MYTWPKSVFYRVTAILLWGLFLAALVMLVLGKHTGMMPSLLWLFALIPPVTVVIQFFLAYRLVAREDEFARALTAKRLLAAAGLTIALTTGLSVAEQFMQTPILPLWLIYPVFWGLFGLMTPLIRDSRP